MRRATFLLLVPLLSGCSSDLFHPTAWPSACELDPATPGCPVLSADASDDNEASDDAFSGD
jgi:hypothetical protein